MKGRDGRGSPLSHFAPVPRFQLGMFAELCATAGPIPPWLPLSQFLSQFRVSKDDISGLPVRQRRTRTRGLTTFCRGWA